MTNQLNANVLLRRWTECHYRKWKANADVGSVAAEARG